MLASVFVLILSALVPLPSHALDATALGKTIQEMEFALLRNQPKSASCTVTVVFTWPDAQGRFVDAARQTPLRVLWKSPGLFTISLVKPLAAALPKEDDLSTYACRGAYFDAQVVRLARVLMKTTRLNRVEGLTLSPLQTFIMTLRADTSARLLGPATIDGRKCVGLEFPNAPQLLPLNIAVERLKIWTDGQNYLPTRIRFFTRRQGVLTFDIAYASYQDVQGNKYLLPERVVLRPAEGEEVPPAAFPLHIYITDYKLNIEIPDTEFE